MLGGAAAVGYYFLKVKGQPTPPGCTEGETRCDGYSLYECQNGEWVLIEEKSEQCGYTPPPPPPPPEEYVAIKSITLP